MKTTVKIIGAIAIITVPVFLSSCVSKKKMQHYFFSYAKTYKKTAAKKNPEMTAPPEMTHQSHSKADSAVSVSTLYTSLEKDLPPHQPK